MDRLTLMLMLPGSPKRNVATPNWILDLPTLLPHLKCLNACGLL